MPSWAWSMSMECSDGRCECLDLPVMLLPVLWMGSGGHKAPCSWFLQVHSAGLSRVSLSLFFLPKKERPPDDWRDLESIGGVIDGIFTALERCSLAQTPPA